MQNFLRNSARKTIENNEQKLSSSRKHHHKPFTLVTPKRYKKNYRFELKLFQYHRKHAGLRENNAGKNNSKFDW